jgi:hypothetical protein
MLREIWRLSLQPYLSTSPEPLASWRMSSSERISPSKRFRFTRIFSKSSVTFLPSLTKRYLTLPTKCRSWATFVVFQSHFETQKKHPMRLYLCFSISSGLTEKSNHYGVFFKPFSDSLKMKRLSSDLVSSHLLNWFRRTFLKQVSF